MTDLERVRELFKWAYQCADYEFEVLQIDDAKADLNAHLKEDAEREHGYNMRGYTIEAQQAELARLWKNHMDDAAYIEGLRESETMWANTASNRAVETDIWRARYTELLEAVKAVIDWSVPIVEPDPDNPQTEYGQIKKYLRAFNRTTWDHEGQVLPP